MQKTEVRVSPLLEAAVLPMHDRALSAHQQHLDHFGRGDRFGRDGRSQTRAKSTFAVLIPIPFPRIRFADTKFRLGDPWPWAAR